MIEKHAEYTDSDMAKKILSDFENEKKKFVRVIPGDYKKYLEILSEQKKLGIDDETAILAAFEGITAKKKAV